MLSSRDSRHRGHDQGRVKHSDAGATLKGDHRNHRRQHGQRNPSAILPNVVQARDARKSGE